MSDESSEIHYLGDSAGNGKLSICVRPAPFAPNHEWWAYADALEERLTELVDEEAPCPTRT